MWNDPPLSLRKSAVFAAALAALLAPARVGAQPEAPAPADVPCLERPEPEAFPVETSNPFRAPCVNGDGLHWRDEACPAYFWDYLVVWHEAGGSEELHEHYRYLPEKLENRFPRDDIPGWHEAATAEAGLKALWDFEEAPELIRLERRAIFFGAQKTYRDDSRLTLYPALDVYPRAKKACEGLVASRSSGDPEKQRLAAVGFQERVDRARNLRERLAKAVKDARFAQRQGEWRPTLLKAVGDRFALIESWVEAFKAETRRARDRAQEQMDRTKTHDDGPKKD